MSRILALSLAATIAASPAMAGDWHGGGGGGWHGGGGGGWHGHGGTCGWCWAGFGLGVLAALAAPYAYAPPPVYYPPPPYAYPPPGYPPPGYAPRY